MHLLQASAFFISPQESSSHIIADNANGELDKDKFEALYHSYRALAGACKVHWETVLASGFSGMLGWLDYSFMRSLGIESTSIEEQELGTKQVFGILKALKQYARQRILLKAWLEARL